MDFDLSEEQRLLADNVARLLKDHYSFENRKTYQGTALGFSEELWRRYAELGLLGLPFSEEDGGFGGGAVETMLIMEAFGGALALEPYVATVVLAGGLVKHAAAPQLRAEFVPQIAAGDLRLAFAHSERQSGWDLFDVAASARKDGAAYVLNGEKGLVLHGDSADKLIVSARVAGGQRERAGLGLFLIDGAAAGVARRGYATQDGQRAAEIALTNVRVEPDAVIGDPESAGSAIERVVDEAIAALCAEAVGAMSEAQTMTVDYLKTRKQFGVPIGSFQALQHRAADMVVALEQARSMMMYATMMAGEADAAARGKAISAAKAQIGRSAKFIGQQATQLHGGIAMTYEYKLGHLFKRMTMIDMAFGDAEAHLRRLSEADSLFAA
ncbi:MAG: acyl-CoA dehydrogenase family protein [Hyphomicrobiales bacterium]|nr:acyl-CoA dehydrogenase family protein [Hyphomicrobiales bacterium]